MKNGDIKRLEWLDFVRCIAVTCVVLCHVVEGGIYNISLEYMQTVGHFSKIFAFAMFSIGRMGVPFFLMISGWLLLDREYTSDACKKFWKNKILGLMLAIEIWIIVYDIFLRFFNGADLSIKSLIKELLLLKNSPMNHMWYMPMILGMYITLPIVANALHTMEVKIILIPYIIILFVFFGIPTANVFTRLIGITVGETIVSSGFSGGTYGLYLITGFLLKKGVLKSVKNRRLIACCIISFIITVLMQVSSFEYNISYNLWYNNLFLLISSIMCFEVLSRIKRIPWSGVSTLIAKYSFAIYLIHNPINMICTRYSVLLPMRPLRVIVVLIITILFSLAISIIIERIPKIGKKILYMR